MPLDEAWQRLGITPTTDLRRVRSAYLARLRNVHPDLSPSPSANDATVELLRAYEVVLESLTTPVAAPPPPGPVTPEPAPHGTSIEQLAGIGLLADDTIGIEAPPNEAYRVALEAAYRLGDVIHVEPSGGLLQVMLDLRDMDGTRRLCQLLVVLQGRGTGITELHCAVEPLDAAPPPPIQAILELFVDEMVEGA